MKKLILASLLLCSLISFSQITFSEVLSLENKSFQEIQAFLFEQYTIIDDAKEYYYFPIKECKPPEYSDDGCQWLCAESNHLDGIKSKYPLDKVIFKKSSNKNYEMWLTLTSMFGDNYNQSTHKATTFIKISRRISWASRNCRNELIEGSGLDMPMKIEIQFADTEHWMNFKSNVTNNATFQETWKLTEDSPIEFRYGIRRKNINGYWKGIFIVLYENSSTYHAEISFDSFGVN